MRAQFLNDDSDFRSRAGGQFARERRGSGMFWWTIVITTLLGIATFCWIFSIMVFKYPEKPFNYELLARLKKLEPLVEFDPLTVPHGEFRSAKEMLKYSDLNAEQLRVKNSLLKRAFILNYKEENPEYIKGTFVVLHSRPLTESDAMPRGWVARARSVDIEDVEVELILPGADPSRAPYEDGQIVSFDNKTTFAVVVNLDRNTGKGPDGVCASVVPIVYGEHLLSGDVKIALEAPERLNMQSHWPLTEPVSIPAARVAAKVQ